MYVYGACWFYVCCYDSVVVCGNVSCVVAIIEVSVFLALKCLRMLYVCVRKVMDVVVYVCIVRRGAVGALFCMTFSLLMLI